MNFFLTIFKFFLIIFRDPGRSKKFPGLIAIYDTKNRSDIMYLWFKLIQGHFRPKTQEKGQVEVKGLHRDQLLV